MKTPTAPQSGAPVTANWGREVCDALRRMRLQAGPGIRLSQTPEGTTISAPITTMNVRHAIMEDEVCLAVVVSGDGAAGYQVALFATGLDQARTGTGTLFFPETAAYSGQDLQPGAVLVAHSALVKLVEGLVP